jgi:hypothetical protein
MNENKSHTLRKCDNMFSTSCLFIAAAVVVRTCLSAVELTVPNNAIAADQLQPARATNDDNWRNSLMSHTV